MFWGTDPIAMGYWKCSVEGVCPIMLFSSNPTQILCLWRSVAKFFIITVKIPDYLSAPEPLSVNGAGGKVYSALSLQHDLLASGNCLNITK